MEDVLIIAKLYTGTGLPENIVHSAPVELNCAHGDIMLQRVKVQEKTAYIYSCIHCGTEINPLNIHIQQHKEYR